MHILAVGAHYDDIELGCSGTLIKHIKKGDRVTMVVVSDSGYADPNGNPIRSGETARIEGKKAARIIGADLISLEYKTFFIPFDEHLTSQLLQIINTADIDTIYTHWTHDVHRDHQSTARSVLMAGRHVPRILMFQSNWYSGDHSFNPVIYSDISLVFEKKIKAISAHRSELGRTGDVWLNYIKDKNSTDGTVMGVQFAETFMPVRYLLPEMA